MSDEFNLKPEGMKLDKPEYSDEFLKFWELYPRRQQKLDAARAWRQVNRNGKLTEKIMDAIAVHARRKDWREPYIPLPASWLRAGSWDDELEPWQLNGVPVDDDHCPECGRTWRVHLAYPTYPDRPQRGSPGRYCPT